MPVKITIQPIYAKPKNHPAEDMKAVLSDLERYMKRDAANVLLKDMRATVRNWDGPPNFVAEYSEPYNGARMQLWVHPSGRNTLKWSRVSMGTGPRQIIPKRGGTMVFPKDYKPKTTARGSYGGPGVKYGPIQFRRIIQRHAIEPREFSLKIKDKRESQFERDINKLIAKRIQ